MIKIKEVVFEGSFPRVSGSPSGDMPEFALIGRSNVGKSSLLNYLLDRKDVARVSRTPGKTAHLNFYKVNQSWRFVDLPGYGYAVASKSKLKKWEAMVRDYFVSSRSLACTMVLIDGNIPPQKIDLEFISWLGENGLPLMLVFTKMDKSKPRIYKKNRKAFEQRFLENWENLPPIIQTSSEKRLGREAVLDFISETLS